MLLNSSKTTTSLQCWRKALNSQLRGLRGETTYGLVGGTSFHAAIAEGMATKDWDSSYKKAESEFWKGQAGRIILPGEEALELEHLRIVKKMVQCYKENYAEEEYTVIQPECRFAVDLPNTEHHDPFIHWLEFDLETRQWNQKWNHSRFIDFSKPVEEDCLGEDGKTRTRFHHPYRNGELADFCQDRMDVEKLLRGHVISPHSASLESYLVLGGEKYLQYIRADDECSCFCPHQLRGIADAIVLWKGTVWLHEHKTTSILNATWWDEFKLDIQPTIYLYGIWKSTKLRPRGFIINVIVKPSDRMVDEWNKKRRNGPPKGIEEYIRYEREAFTRTEEDLDRIEKQLITNGDDWLRRFLLSSRGVDTAWPMSNVKNICTMYYRLCDYHGICMAHDAEHEVQAFRNNMLIQIERRKVELAELAKEDET